MLNNVFHEDFLFNSPVLLCLRIVGHINNQYNTCFWMLVKSGKSKSEAQDYLKVVNFVGTHLRSIFFFWQSVILSMLLQLAH